MNIQQYIAPLIDIVQKAGQAILEVKKDFAVNHKTDGSPLTDADTAASTLILDFLNQLTPNIPIICEETWKNESDKPPYELFWLVDPLDGTKEFIKGYDDYTVNIALVQNGTAIFGIVGKPETGEIWYGAENAYKIEEDGTQKQLQVRAFSPDFIMVESRSHAGAETEAWKEKYKPANSVQMGSSLKICIIAEGKADAYPRLGPTMIWDIAAAHAVLKAAGGDVFDTNHQPLTYNKAMKNPYFIAIPTTAPLRLAV